MFLTQFTEKSQFLFHVNEVIKSYDGPLNQVYSNFYVAVKKNKKKKKRKGKKIPGRHGDDIRGVINCKSENQHRSKQEGKIGKSNNKRSVLKEGPVGELGGGCLV